jgi:DNA-binding response OmpR family regulator
VPKILLVEDDKDLALLVKEWLNAENYSLDIAHDGMSICVRGTTMWSSSTGICPA